MYSELEVQFLTDECDTVLAYENKGTSDQDTERRDPLMDTLNSMNRVQQVELICGKYNFIFRIYLNTFKWTVSNKRLASGLAEWCQTIF